MQELRIKILSKMNFKDTELFSATLRRLRILRVTKQPTIEEIKNKEILLLDKLTKIAETIKDVMNEEEKNVIMSYFAEKIK